MDLFEPLIADLRIYLDSKSHRPDFHVSTTAAPIVWPEGQKGSIVMLSDTAVELGNPEQASASFLLWTENRTLINDRRVTLIGGDIRDGRGESLPFGFVSLLGVKAFDDSLTRDRHLEMELKRFDLNLSGYMMRAVVQHGRQWSRISREAVDGGFSFDILGGALIQLYRSLPYVDAAEVIFVTSSIDDVLELSALGAKADQLASALKKMTTENSFDCDNCEYSPLCNEVESLRSLKKKRGREFYNA